MWMLHVNKEEKINYNKVLAIKNEMKNFQTFLPQAPNQRWCLHLFPGITLTKSWNQKLHEWGGNLGWNLSART